MAQYGAATLAHYLEELLRYTERRTRAAFAEFPDGRFAADMLMDGDMVSMVSGADRRRSYVVDGAPVVTGVVAVGDAWACTNPSLGRGSAMALLHCVRLRELVRAGIHHPVALAAAWDADTRPSTFGPGTKPADRQRFREMEAAIHGVSADPAPAIMDAFGRAVAHDADVFRSLLEIRQVLALPSEVFGRAGFVDRVLEVAAGRQAMPPPGPTRRELLDLIA